MRSGPELLKGDEITVRSMLRTWTRDDLDSLEWELWRLLGLCRMELASRLPE